MPEGEQHQFSGDVSWRVMMLGFGRKAGAGCATSRTHAIKLQDTQCVCRVHFECRSMESDAVQLHFRWLIPSGQFQYYGNTNVASPSAFIGRHFKMEMQANVANARASKKHDPSRKGSTFLWVYKSPAFDLFTLKSISLRICSVHWQFNDIF